jgi:hypothetical protein
MKKLTIKVFIFSLILLNFTNVFSQERERPSFERMKAMKMTYISEEINFTSSEEAFFWKTFDVFDNMIYRDLWEESKKIRKIKFEIENKLSNKKSLEILKEIIAIKKKETDAWENRNIGLLKELSPTTVLKIIKLEEKWWMTMMNKRKKGKIKEEKKE